MFDNPANREWGAAVADRGSCSVLNPDTEPVATLLAGEALQVVDIGPGPHHHLKGRDDLLAGGTVARGPKQPA